MTRSKLLLFAALTVLAAAVVWQVRAQEMTEGGSVAAENMTVEGAVTGELKEPTPALEEAAAEAPEAPAEAPAVEAPEAPAEAPAGSTTLAEEVADAVGTANTAAEEAPAAAGTGDVPRLEKEGAEPVSLDVRTLGEGEELRRRTYEQHAMEKLGQAEAALAEQRYDEAKQLFELADKAFLQAGNRPQTRAKREQIRLGVKESVYGQALVFIKQRDFKAAEARAKEAVTLGHPLASKLLEDIQEMMKIPEPPPKPTPVRWQQETYKQEQKTVADFLKAAREYFLAGEYDKAQTAFERALMDDPQNTEAIRWREKVAQKKYMIATEELQSTREDMMAQVRRSWHPRTYGLEDIGEPIEMEKKAAATKPIDDVRKIIIDKMQKIVFPEVDFRQAGIRTVVEWLQDNSVKYDPTTDVRFKRGVNIILHARAAGLTPSPAAEAGDEAGVTEEQQLTFKARDISLFDVLRTITDVVNLKYRISGNVVMIVPADMPDSEIIHRTYDVLPSIAERIPTISAEAGATGGFDSDFRSIGVATIDADRTDWKEFFQSMGVGWPAGSSIKYLPSLSKILVANTADNLAVFEDRLQELNVVPSQVEIETRFIEVVQTDLSSLGFEYLLTDAWEVAQRQGDASLPWGQRQRIVVGANSVGPTVLVPSATSGGTASGTTPVTLGGGFTSGNRFLTDSIETLTGGTAVNDRLLSIATVLTNPELAFVLHALNQKGNSDLLSAPRVVTQSGMEATIKVVVEYIYPTEFTITPIQASAANGTTVPVGGIVEPGGFETREVGVILTVIPTVTPESQLISLTLAPQVVDDPIWKDYGSQYQLPDGTTVTMPMPQPFFPSRSIQTSILIYNGATVVMGGMINEARSSVDDRVPLLGDLPLIGRLFQSKSDSSEKRNLLIFVTARLVDPAGRGVGKPKKLLEATATKTPPVAN